MQGFKNFFKDKKVTVVGLGLLGKRLGDIAFLVENGAKVTVTDLKRAEELAPSLKKLEKYKKPAKGRAGIQYSLGGHKFEDFENKDFILKGQGVPLDSPYIAHARKHGIPVEMDESLFAKLAPDVTIIGVTGTRGKSTTTILIYEILKAAGLSVYLGGNIKGTAALPLLKKVKKGDVVVFELSSWQLQGFGEAKISPHISVFTNFMPDHMNYYNNDLKQYFQDKAYIYKFQNKSDILVLGKGMKGLVKDAKSKVINANVKNIPKSWKIGLKGAHNMENVACAVEVARVMGVSEVVMKKAVANFKPISGRMELVKVVKGVEIYNDTNSCTPEATSAALQALGTPQTRQRRAGKNIVLIMGGSDKNLDFTQLFKDIKKYVKEVILIPGNGTNRILPDLRKTKVPIYEKKDLKEIVAHHQEATKKGDIVLFSPAFTSFGMFTNEYDRGEKFMKIIKQLK